MRICRDYKTIPEHLKGFVVALGNFDGIHRGHQEVIKRTVELAEVMGTKPAVVTFEPHPREMFGKMGFLHKNIAPIRISSFRTRVRLMEEMGIDVVMALRFNKELFRMPPNEFISTVLNDSLKVKHIVVGEDFFFGKNRKGNVSLMEKEATKHGFGFTQVRLEGTCCKNPYSSTTVRDALAQGDVEKARKVLGRNYHMEGKVYRGDSRGRTMGYRTANITIRGLCTPARGVYAVKIKVDGREHLGVANVGFRPTFLGTELMLEVHIFDFNKDIYGKRASVSFIKRIRAEKKFKNSDALHDQISKDCREAKTILQSRSIFV